MDINAFINDNKELKIISYKQGINNPQNLGAVYFICDKNEEIIYIGCTSKIKMRLQTHACNIDFINCHVFCFWDTYERCKEWERKLIREIFPRFNYQIPGVGIFEKPPQKPTVHLLRTEKVRPLQKIIRQKMKRRKLSYSYLSRETGIHTQTVINTLSMSGGMQERSLIHLYKLCNYFGVKWPRNLNKVLKLDPHKIIKF